jgi:hypothetical protein
MNRIALITLAGSLAACSSSSTPTPAQYDDTAQAIAAATAPSGGGGDVASIADSVSLAQGTMPTGFTLTADGHFNGTRLGVDYDYSLVCKSATGTVGACGSTTDQATVNVAWSGTLSAGGVDASVSRSGSWSLTGLTSATATFSGSSTFSFDATLRSVFRPGATATYTFDASANYDAIHLDTQQRQVIDGSASFDVAAHAAVTGAGSNNADASFDVHAEITFHADHTADLVLDGSQHYSLNLTSGSVVRASN